ncbi:MAG TPA: MmgE/PrpD family protein, partial [Burkholderiales bacterium]|nr:MmgE/PrpD family protein [Burkholderiales bacterium]
MTIAQELARRINALHYDTLPQAAVHWAKVGILDTIGVTLAGSNDPSATLLAAAISSGAGPSLVYGTAKRISPLDAALVNGTA